jgi:hypothetical protein
MANISIITNPGLITAADTNDNVLTIPDTLAPVLGSPQRTAFIEVTVGTFRFSSGTVLTGAVNEPTYTVGNKVIITFTQELPLHFKATTAADAFKISM